MATDAQLVARWRGGDRQACASLFERHYPSVLRFFRSKASSEVHDLCQRTFLTCLRKIDGLQDPERFRSYLLGMAYNQFREHLRARARDRIDFGTVSVADLGPSPSSWLAHSHECQAVVESMQAIPIEHQVVLELHYWESLTVAEIAQIITAPVGTVKSRLLRARALLKSQLEGRRSPSRSPEITESEVEARIAALGKMYISARDHR